MAQEKRIHSVLSAFSHSGVFICFVCASLLYVFCPVTISFGTSVRYIPSWAYSRTVENRETSWRAELNVTALLLLCSAESMYLSTLFQFKQQHINKREWHWAVFKGCFHLCVFACDIRYQMCTQTFSEIFSLSAISSSAVNVWLTDKNRYADTHWYSTYTCKTSQTKINFITLANVLSLVILRALFFLWFLFVHEWLKERRKLFEINWFFSSFRRCHCECSVCTYIKCIVRLYQRNSHLYPDCKWLFAKRRVRLISSFIIADLIMWLSSYQWTKNGI